jgi:ArsR family transcriptional regulator, arsenate/arsenite/antimonite-responsive transcriptional repressor
MKSLKKQSEIFKSLSEPNRIRIIKMLQERSLCVCEITEILQLAASTVSKHLSILKNSGFIVDEKDNKWINYRINPNPDDPGILSALFSVKLMMEDDETIKKDRQKMRTVNREELCKI